MMKKLLLALVVALSALGAAAQEFRYGPTVGATLSSLSFKQDLFEVNAAPGASAGLQCEFMFPGIGFGIDFGLVYETRGAKLHLGDRRIWASQGYTDPRSWLHYLDIPLHLRFKWTRMNGFEDYAAPFVFAGPSFGFLIGHNRIPALEYATGEVGVCVGLGVELLRRWQVSGSYTWGMTYALKTRLLTDMSAKNRTWDLRVTYLF